MEDRGCRHTRSLPEGLVNAGQQQFQAGSRHEEARLRRRTLGGYRYVRMRWRLLFGCVDAVGSLVFAIARFLSRCFSCRNAIGAPKRILLVQFDHFGDAVITTAMFGALKQRYPNARIDVLAAPWNHDVFDSVAEVDKVYVCRHNRFAPSRGLAWIPATVAWGWCLRRERYDLAIDVRGEFPHNVLLWFTGARQRLGWSSGGGGFLLTHKPEYVVNRPEIDSRAALLEVIGITNGAPIQPVFCPSPAATQTAGTAWSEFGDGGQLLTLDTHQAQRPQSSFKQRAFPQSCQVSRVDPANPANRIVLHIGAGTSAKRWPAEHWRRLVACLSAEGNAHVALVGTSNDTQTARAILGASAPASVADWTGRFSVDELAAVLQEADVLVGADSGPAHLAAAVGTAVIALFSGTNSVEQWQPRGRSVRVLRADVPCSPCHLKACPVAGHRCMRGVLPDHVIHALNQSLEEGSNKTHLVASSRNTKGLTQ